VDIKSATRKEHTMKTLLTSSYVKLTTLVAVAVALAVTCGHGGWN
jgi:hypothetical protein